jgi:dTDP-4-dehydrorhamnose 3,5-epimerase
MKVVETDLVGVVIITPQVFQDTRGYFFESFQKDRYAKCINLAFVQDNVSRSCQNVIRGLHHQTKHTQAKLVYVVGGAIFDIAVDIRKGSPTFGQWTGIILDDQDHKQFYIPAGFAHGFSVLSDTADVVYKCTDYYDATSELTIQWDDPDLNIDWLIQNPHVSDKDKQAKRLREIPEQLLPVYV